MGPGRFAFRYLNIKVEVSGKAYKVLHRAGYLAD